MEDTRRFLRFVIPGLTFVIETGFYLIFLTEMDITRIINLCGNDPCRILKESNSVALILTVFLLSGGLGYLLGMLYHLFYGQRWIAKLLNLGDHRELLRYAVKIGYLEFYREDEGKEKRSIDDITRDGAWRIANALWHERVELSSEIKGAKSRTDSLSDIMHGLGTALIGALAALTIWLFTDYTFSRHFTIEWYWFIPFVILYIHWRAYYKTIPQAYGVVDKVLLGVLREESGYGRWPVIALVNERDLR